MNPLTTEWFAKAEGDWVTAWRELRARKSPNYDAACFHAQQCAEKYLKACLQESGTPFGKTHNLLALMELLIPLDSLWDSIRSDVQDLSAYAVRVRYPGETSDKRMAREAVKHCEAIRSHARQALGLAP